MTAWLEASSPWFITAPINPQKSSMSPTVQLGTWLQGNCVAHRRLLKLVHLSRASLISRVTQRGAESPPALGTHKDDCL